MTCAGHALLAPNVADSSSEEDEEEEDSPAADKRLVPVHSLLHADVIGLYFGAGRSKPSRKFERLLHKAYAKLAPGAGDAQRGTDGNFEKEEAARPTREDLRVLRLERTRRAKTLQKLFDKLAIPVRQRPIADVYHPATLRPFSPGGGPIEWTRRPSVAWTWAPPKEEAPPLTPAGTPTTAKRHDTPPPGPARTTTEE